MKLSTLRRASSSLAIAWLIVITGGRCAIAQNSGPTTAGAASRPYAFTRVATLGDSAPGGGFHITDFEPGAINNLGEVIYGTDLGTSKDPGTWIGEGVFLRRPGQKELELARSTGAAPGGGLFDTLLLGATSINDAGDAAFAFTLQPFGQPVGVNSGVYRLASSGNTRNVSPVVLSEVTPAPGGGKFKGVAFNTILNERGDILFTGIIATDKGIHVPDQDYTGLGVGVFKADALGRITSIVSPGDPAPGGGVFDHGGSSGAGGAWINKAGDVAFTAHVAGEETLFPNPPFPSQAELISALGSVYFKDALTGTVRSIAHVGEAAPGGGVFREIPSLALNNSGDIAFVGDITPKPDINQFLNVYLHSGNTTVAVARAGDAMPGGGHFVRSGFGTSMNNSGDVVVNALLDTQTDGVPDTGLYVWSRGTMRLIARSGTVIPGVGKVSLTTTGTGIVPPPPAGALFPFVAPINDRGQLLFGATLTDGQGVLLLATSADINGDGTVDCADVAMVTTALGTQAGQPGWDVRADVIADGVIDVRDLAFVSQQLPVGTRCK